MKISLRWLCDHIDIQDYLAKPEEISRLLTGAGLEVEGVENPGEKFKNVVVGHIIKLDRHPNADRLTVCQVDTGEGSPRQIVCGAKNHKAGRQSRGDPSGCGASGKFRNQEIQNPRCGILRDVGE
jgi:phenylalanyl-tRNA synthetase beta chain